MGLRAIGVATLVALSASSPAPSSVEAGKEFARRMFESIGAKQAECGAGSRLSALRADQLCARWNGEWERFRKSWDRAARHLPVAIRGESIEVWAEEGAARVRRYEVGGTPVAVVRDTDRGTIEVVISRDLEPCGTAWSALTSDALDERETRTPDGAAVKPLERVRLTWPPGLQHRTRDASVVLKALVLEDGTVGATCVASSTPGEPGLERDAASAVRRSRYAPVIRDGAPVRFVTEVVVRWTVR